MNNPSNRASLTIDVATIIGILALTVAIIGVSWSIYSSRSQSIANEAQIDALATQITHQEEDSGKQDAQIIIQQQLIEQNDEIIDALREANNQLPSVIVETDSSTPTPSSTVDSTQEITRTATTPPTTASSTTTATPTPRILIEATQTAEALAELFATREALQQEQASLSATQTVEASLNAAQTAEASTVPLRERVPANVGTGVFSNVFTSDGMAEFTDASVNGRYPRIQMNNVNLSQDGCSTARYDSSSIWFGSTEPTMLSVNGESIGQYTEQTFNGSHGMIFDHPISQGDNICVQLSDGMLYHVVVGPDVDAHFDTYCYRGNC